MRLQDNSDQGRGGKTDLKPMSHIAASGMISIFVWCYFKSFACGAISFAAGIIMDLDYFIDYCANHPFTINPKTIYRTYLHARFYKVCKLFHSYELVIMLWVVIYAFSLSNFWKAAALGLTQHILLDQITNPMKSVFGYFLTYRAMKKFREESLKKHLTC